MKHFITLQVVRGSSIMLVILLCLVGLTTARYNLSNKGDIIIGGMFPILKTQSCSCDISSKHCDLFPKGLFLAEAMVYALHLVNKRRILPFNISLGYSIRDTCATLSVAVDDALFFASHRKNKQSPHEGNRRSKQGMPSVIGVIGAGNSELSLAVNNILSLYNIPQVAYASSATFLNDKSRYKTFLRVLPPDILQAKAIAQLIAHFHWNYISLVSCDNHYSNPLRHSFREQARLLEICLSNDIVLSERLPTVEVIERRLKSIKQTNNSNVILVFASEQNAKTIFKAAIAQNLTNHVWIASDSWSNALTLFQQQHSSIRGSALGVFFGYTPVTGFIKHLKNRLNKYEETSPNKDPWLRDLSYALNAERIHLKSNNPQDENNYWSAFARVEYVIDSVFILSHVIKDYCLELTINSNATEEEKKAKCLETIVPKDLLRFLFNRTIMAFSKNFTIDEKGDPSGTYDFYNIQAIQGTLRYIKIGMYNSKTMSLQVNDSMIDLGEGKGRVPESRCSPVCPPGYYVIRERAIQCCYECKLCPANEIGNVTMTTSCMACNDDHMANSNRSQCIYVALKYVAWGQPWTIVLGLFTMLGFLLSVFVMVVFIRHRNSPVVRASCFEISIILILSIALGFLLPIFNLSKPSDRMCKASAFFFAVIFTLILSLTLAKINRTVLILNNRLVSQGKSFHTRFLLSRRAHFTSVLVLISIQVAICTAWFYKQPPQQMITKRPPPNPSRYLHCTNHTSYWFLISSGFLIFLSLLCTILAFRSRNFPENYNHAKFVSFAMFTFDMVWLTFMGAYYGKTEHGLHHPVIDVCAILFSNILLLLFFFAPKVYVIFFRPELNNARTFREMNLQHILIASGQTMRTYSLALLQGHENVYLMDCDGNNKAVQTPRTYTRDVHTQTDFKPAQPTVSLMQRMFRIGSSRRRGHGAFKRGFSESDTPHTFDPIAISGLHSYSSPHPLCPLSQLGNLSNGKRMRMIEEDNAFGTDVTMETLPTANDTPNAETIYCIHNDS